MERPRILSPTIGSGSGNLKCKLALWSTSNGAFGSRPRHSSGHRNASQGLPPLRGIFLLIEVTHRDAASAICTDRQQALPGSGTHTSPMPWCVRNRLPPAFRVCYRSIGPGPPLDLRSLQRPTGSPLPPLAEGARQNRRVPIPHSGALPESRVATRCCTRSPGGYKVVLCPAGTQVTDTGVVLRCIHGSLACCGNDMDVPCEQT
jgi:hypothetical protein